MKIILATGGSGGHIFPALNVGRSLKEKGHEVLFVGVFGESAKKIQSLGFSLINLSARGLYFSSWLSSVGCMLKSCGESYQILKRFNPESICGFGGYGAFSVVLMGALSGCPTMIHEQNVVPGKANLFLAKFVKKIAITFEESRKYFKNSKTVLTGSPCHAEISPKSKVELKEQFKLEKEKLTIFILGGSQGSHRINTEFIRALPLVKKELDFQVIHISGKNDYPELKNQYNKSDINAATFDFLDDIGQAYQASDLIISRCGAGCVLEIAKFQLPSILIPYPLAGGHQRENGRVLERTNTSRMIEERDLTEKVLAGAILDMVRHPVSQDLMKDNLNDVWIPNATGRIAEEILSLGKTR